MRRTVTVLLFAAAVVGQPCDKKIGEEYPPADEDKWIKAVTAGNVQAAVAQMPKEVVRGAHGKTNACARATWVTDQDVPAHLRAGVFTPGAQFDAWVRFSNGAGNSKEGDDRDPDVRGLAIKLLGVSGERAARPAQRGYKMREDTTQDFVFISSEKNAFITRIVQDYISPGIPGVFKVCPSCAAAAADINSHYKIANPLNITYGSLVNYVFDSTVNPTGKVGMKYYVTPCDPSKTVPSSAKTNGNSTVNRNFQRDALAEQLAPGGTGGVCMQFGVQLQADACKQPMEDASVAWGTTRVPIAKVTFSPQHLTNSNQLAMCENLSMNPWHSLKAHRPAGGVSRARLDIYFEGSGKRYELNDGGCAHVDPTSPCLKDVTNMLQPAGAKCPFSNRG